MCNKFIKSLSITLVVCLLAGCNIFSNKPVPSDSVSSVENPKSTVAESSEERKETTVAASSTVTTTESASFSAVSEEKPFQLEDSMLDPILSDTIAFMFDPEELYICDVNGDGIEDNIFLKDYYCLLMSYMSGDELCVLLPDLGGNLRLELYYSYTLEKFVIHRSKGVASYGFDEYMYFDNGVFVQDCIDRFEREDGIFTEEYIVRGENVTEEDFNSRVSSLELTDLSPVEIDPVRKTDIPSDQIPVLKDKLLTWANDPNKKPLLTDLNKDGIQDCVISFDPHDDIWENANFITESLRPEANFIDCTLILLSGEDGIEIRYYCTDEAAQVVTDMLIE